MGSSETDTPSKAPKTSAVQEHLPPAVSSSPAPTTVYPDWSGFQAYSPIPPHGFFHSPVASSPQGHPYMWGAQGSHPFSPYAMPSPNGNAEVSGAAPGGGEVDGKEGKERSPIKRSKGSLGSLNMITGKTNNELGKTSGASANGVYSQSGESGTEGSSDSDANSQNDSQPKTFGGQDCFDAEASQNGTTARSSQNGLPRAPSQTMLNQTMPLVPMPAVVAPGSVAGPTTNLNIGMDYWGASTPSAIPPVRGKVPGNAVAGAVVVVGLPGSRDNMSSELWRQDERELKRQRRKQSNRESARRSRLRKQAECEELALRVEGLKEENTALRAEVEQIRKGYDQLLAQNTSLKERLGESSRRTEDTELDKNDQDPGDDAQKLIDSDGQAGQTDTTQSGR